jgi:hypothetical protein
MSVRFCFATLLLLAACCAMAGISNAQEKKSPVSKQELLRLLRPTPGARSMEQGDIAGQILERGIAFPVDEQTLSEFRRAGARSFLIEAIEKAAKQALEPPAQAAPAAAAPDRPRLKAQSEEPPQLTPEEEKAAREAALATLPLIEKARYYADEYLENLPNFIVTQFVTRSARRPGKKDWEIDDKLEIELSYSAEKGEKFKLVRINDKPTSMDYSQLKGATSTGEFGSMLASLFSPDSKTDFKEIRPEMFRNRKTVVYDYRVKKAFSANRITDKNSGRSVITAYSGSVWIDVETARALRIEQASEDIQPGFPITMAESAVEFDWVKIDDRPYLLPTYAEVILGSDPERFYSRNVIELKNYKMFETELKILPEKDPPR